MNQKDLNKYKNNKIGSIYLTLNQLDLLYYLIKRIPIEYTAIVGTKKLFTLLHKSLKENK